jgi:hypothetical protein
MTINATLDTFYGKPVKEFRTGDGIDGSDVVYRLTQDYDDEQAQDEFLNEFLDKAGAARLEAIVIGAWSEAQSEPPEGFLDALIARRSELGALRAIFIGDMTYEECEISWIVQTDYAPLLAAFPALEVLRVRGATDLVLPAFEHASLRELAIESGGLPDAIVHGIAQSKLPALNHLELWLGDENYGFGGSLAPYAQLLAAIKPERLAYLGLRNAAISDEIAGHVAQQPWLSQLHTLDLSMGTLGDRGANALADSPHIGGLQRLDVRHHYIGDAAVARLKALPLDLIIDEAEDEDDGERYVEVAE